MAHFQYLDQHCPGWDQHGVVPALDLAVQVKQFWDMHGRFPSKVGVDHEERKLGQWLDRQRQRRRMAATATQMTPAEQALRQRLRRPADHNDVLGRWLERRNAETAMQMTPAEQAFDEAMQGFATSGHNE
jgi:hypothetical protein